MKGLLKTAAILCGLAGGIALGFLINLSLTKIPYFALALVAVLAILFVGGTALVALFIFLWAKANGELDKFAEDEQVNEETTVE